MQLSDMGTLDGMSGKLVVQQIAPGRFPTVRVQSPSSGPRPAVICAAAKRQRERLKNPPMCVDEFLAALERQGLAQTVAELRRFADVI